jgi:hypothetical protein
VRRLASEGALIALVLSAHHSCDIFCQDRVSLWGVWCVLGWVSTSVARNGWLLLDQDGRDRDAYMLSRTIPRVKIVTARA